jgi:hypothetical protein
MESKLPEGTMDDSHTATGRHQSQLPRNKTYSNLAQFVQSDKNKSLPQLPDFEWNDSRAWSMMNAPIATTDNTDRAYFHDEEVSNMSATRGENSIDSSPPPIPPKSSKRKSAHPKIHFRKIQEGGETMKKSIVHPQPAEDVDIPTPTKYADNDSVAEAMQRATRNLKGNSKERLTISGADNFRQDTYIAADVKKGISRESMRSMTRVPKGTRQMLLHGPYVPPKETGFKGSKMIAKMRNAFQGSNSRSCHDSDMNQRLLDPFPGGSQECDEMALIGAGLSEGEMAPSPFTPCTN